MQDIYLNRQEIDVALEEDYKAVSDCAWVIPAFGVSGFSEF